MENELAPLQAIATAINASLLDGASRFADASRVGQPNRDAADARDFLDCIARCAWNRRDDGAILAEQGVHQARLTCVGASNDGDGDALAKNLAFVSGREKLLQEVDDN